MLTKNSKKEQIIEAMKDIGHCPGVDPAVSMNGFF